MYLTLKDMLHQPSDSGTLKVMLVRSLVLVLILGSEASAQTAKPRFTWETRLAKDPPLTGLERAKIFLHNDFASVGTIVRTVGPAIAGQFANQPIDWGRTPEGFGRRIGLGFVTFTAQDAIQHSSAALLGLDPRYQRCECKGLARRTGHAFSGLFLSANAAGVRRFDPSNIVGSYGSGFIAATLYPDRYSRTVKGAQIGHAQVGGVVISNLFQEFGPDIKRILKRKKKP